MIKGLSHLLFQVANLKQSEEFYVGVLGMSVKERSSFGPGKQPLTVLKEGIGLTEVRMTGAGPVVRNVEHVALKVEDITRLVETLQEHGIPIVDGPKPSAYGTTLYILDPDGNRIECHD